MACAATCAIALAPALTPPPPSAHRIELVGDVQSLAPTGPADDLVSAYDSLRPTVNYGVALAFWAGRFLPIPGAAIYHLSVAYATVVDPMTTSLVHNFGDFLDGRVDLAGALNRIGADFVGSVVDFATTELVGHDNVVPPVDRANGSAGPWVRWIINAAISPLYYLPLPNIITVDQVEIFGELIGTVVASAIDNVAQVVTRTIPVEQALANLWTAVMGVAVPQLVAREVQLLNPPSPPAAASAAPIAAVTQGLSATTDATPISEAASSTASATPALEKAGPSEEHASVAPATVPSVGVAAPVDAPEPAAVTTPPPAPETQAASTPTTVQEVSATPDAVSRDATRDDEAKEQADAPRGADVPDKVARAAEHDDDAQPTATDPAPKKPTVERPSTASPTKDRDGDQDKVGADSHESSKDSGGASAAA